MSVPLIEASGLTVSFGDTLAVDDVSFEVNPGEVVGLLGANGAGKTTTIRMLLGLLRPSAGSAHLLGAPPSLESRRHLGYVPQNLGLYQELTVAENVAFTAQAYGCAPATLTGAVEASADQLVHSTPLGVQRQVAFVCALQHRPRTLVLDEPTSGVDPLARARLWNTIREQADAGVGVLVTTHYMQEARQCDRLLLMSRGAVVGRGSEADIVGDTRVLQVQADSWQQAFDVLDAAGLPVTLDGRRVRVVDSDVETVERLMHDRSIEAAVTPARATIDERMTVLARTS
ncbi:MAG: ATP-binding cassette domain-containing protein [Jiangellales bacterium]